MLVKIEMIMKEATERGPRAIHQLGFHRLPPMGVKVHFCDMDTKVLLDPIDIKIFLTGSASKVWVISIECGKIEFREATRLGKLMNWIRMVWNCGGQSGTTGGGGRGEPEPK